MSSPTPDPCTTYTLRSFFTFTSSSDSTEAELPPLFVRVGQDRGRISRDEIILEKTKRRKKQGRNNKRQELREVGFGGYLPLLERPGMEVRGKDLVASPNPPSRRRTAGEKRKGEAGGGGRGEIR